MRISSASHPLSQSLQRNRDGKKLGNKQTNHQIILVRRIIALKTIVTQKQTLLFKNTSIVNSMGSSILYASSCGMCHVSRNNDTNLYAMAEERESNPSLLNELSAG